MEESKMVNDEKDIIVISHKNCSDGAASTYMIREALGETAEYKAFDHPDFSTAQYKDILGFSNVIEQLTIANCKDFNNIVEKNKATLENSNKPSSKNISDSYVRMAKDIEDFRKLKNKEVVFVDFCPTIEIVELLLRNGNKFKLLDHHHGAEKVIEQINNKIENNIEYFKKDNISITYHGENKKAGVDLAYEAYLEEHGVKKPNFMKYISDGDRNTYISEHENTGAFYKGMNDYCLSKYQTPYPNYDFLKLLSSDDKFLEQIITDGSKKLQESEKYFQENMIEINFKNHKCFLCKGNTDQRVDFAKYVEKKYPNSLAMMYNKNTDGSIAISLRTNFENNGIDTNKLVADLNGGGHPFASGFRMGDISKFESLLRTYNSELNLDKNNDKTIFHKTNLFELNLTKSNTEIINKEVGKNTVEIDTKSMVSSFNKKLSDFNNKSLLQKNSNSNISNKFKI